MGQVQDSILIEKIIKSIKIRGYKKTIDILSFDDDYKAELTSKKDKLIIAEITKVFNITNEDLFHSRYDTGGEIKYAIGFCVYYFYRHKTLGEIHKNIFKTRNKAQLSRYRQMIIDLNPSSKFDAKYIKIKNILNKSIVVIEKNKINE